ncbi:MAG: DUF1284 domain-containing protein [Anaerolineales bacterium]|jgi:hypothetical protein|nr:DUF1284 domain-containing protein [Anaerolineales bacterium]
MILRPHHIYCFHILGLTDPERGQDYLKARDEIEKAFIEEKGQIEVNEGPDMLCAPCTYFNGKGCTHPEGDETQVNKWDAKILQGLNIDYGQSLSIDEMKHLIKESAPLDFCLNRCPYNRAGVCDPNKLPDYFK